MKTYNFSVAIEAENEEDAKQEFSEEFGYDFDGDNWHEVCCFEESKKGGYQK